MRLEEWVDKHGYKHRSLVTDDMTAEDASRGILQDPPSLDELDWEGIKQDLHNNLVNAGLFCWMDVQQKGGLRGAILSAMKRRLVYLYREAEK